jgi:hypothetical protein
MKKLVSQRFNVDPYVNHALFEIVTQINALSEGRANAFYKSQTSIPTRFLEFSNGDFIANANKQELGTAGAKYVVQGWDLVDVAGVLTWRERRTLTGV